MILNMILNVYINQNHVIYNYYFFYTKLIGLGGKLLLSPPVIGGLIFDKLECKRFDSFFIKNWSWLYMYIWFIWIWLYMNHI